MSIRSMAETDAPAFVELCRRLDHESQCMLPEPGERETSVADQQTQLAGLLASPDRTKPVAESAGQLVVALEDWAPSHGIRRLELTVMAHNLWALQLYLKRGFVVEGYKRHAL